MKFLIFLLLSSIFSEFYSLHVKAEASSEKLCYSTNISTSTEAENSCGEGSMCVTTIVKPGMKKFPASCKADYECESNKCEQNICMKIGTCKSCGSNGSPPDPQTNLCCDGLTNSNGKCVFSNTCSDFYNTCQPGYVCKNASNTKSQGLLEMEKGTALQDLSCAPEMVSCLSNSDCCSNICVALPSTLPGVPATKSCMPYKECVLCVEEGRQKSSEIDCCPGLVEEAGFCVKFISPPLAEPSFPYKINRQCGIEWENPDDLMGVYEAEYWMAAFEFIFMSEYGNMNKEGRNSFRAYPNSFMGFNTNNLEIAKSLFIMRNPIDNIYHQRIQKFGSIVKLQGTQSIKYNSQYQYFQDMSNIFTINADRASELGKAYDYILPLFSNALAEIEQHYWGSFQSSSAGINPRNREPGGYDSARQPEYNICSKAMIHHPDSLCIRGCLKFADAQTPVGTNFYFNQAPSEGTNANTNSTNSSEVYRLVDPILPEFTGSTGYVSAESVCDANSASYACQSDVYTNIKNHNTDDASLDECPSYVGNLLNTEDLPSSIVNDRSKSTSNWRNIKITRGIYRKLRPKDASSDSYAFDMRSECDPSLNSNSSSCRWTGESTSCYVKAPAVLKNDDALLKNAKALLIGSWTDQQYTGWEAELALILSLFALFIIFAAFIQFVPALHIAFGGYLMTLTGSSAGTGILAGAATQAAGTAAAIGTAVVGSISTVPFIGLPIKHMSELRYYNLKELSSIEGKIFQKEIGNLFKRYADLHFIKFGKVPNKDGTFAINDGMTVAKNMVFNSYLEAFNQGNNEKGSYMFYGNECHWDGEGQQRIDYLRKTMIFSELLRNFYTSSHYAWKDASECMLKKPLEIITNDGRSMGGSGTASGANSGSISAVQNLMDGLPSTSIGNELSTPNTGGSGNSSSSENTASSGTKTNERPTLSNNNLNSGYRGQVATTQSKTGTSIGTASSAASGSNSANSSQNQKNARLAALKSSPLDQRREEFKNRYGNNKALMDSVNKNYEDFAKGSGKRLATLSQIDTSKLPSAPADRMSLANQANESSNAQQEAKNMGDIESLTNALIGKNSAKLSSQIKSSMPTFDSIQKSLDFYKKDKANYGGVGDFKEVLGGDDKNYKRDLSIHSDKDNVSIFELLNYSYRKNAKKLKFK